MLRVCQFVIRVIVRIQDILTALGALASSAETTEGAGVAGDVLGAC